MSKNDKNLFGDYVMTRLGWRTPIKMRFTNRNSRTAYIIFDEVYENELRRLFKTNFRYLDREIVGISGDMEKIAEWIHIESSSTSSYNFTYNSNTFLGNKNSLI